MKSWNKIRLGDACQTNFDTYSLKDDWSFVNYLDTSNIVDNKIDEIQFIDVTKEELPSRARRKVKHNSIIYSTVRPDQRHFGIIKSQPDNFLVSTGFAVIDVDPIILDADFLYYKLSQNSIVETLHSIAAQSTSAYPAIKPSDLENLELEIPNIETQAKIGKFLRNLDDKIRHNTAINDNLSQAASDIFDYYFLQYEFPDATNKPYRSNNGAFIHNETLKQNIPTGSTVCVIEDFCNIFTGNKDVNQAFDFGQYRFYSCAPTHKYSNEKIYEGAAILISGNGSYTGRTIYVDTAFDLYQRTYACTNKDGVDKDILIYLYFCFLRFLVPRISGGTHGSAIPYIVRDDIAKMPIVYNENAISNFLQKVKPMISNIVRIEEENLSLINLRNTLLPLLMNGQVTINN